MRYKLDEPQKVIYMTLGFVYRVEVSPCGRFFATGSDHKISIYHQSTHENLVSITEVDKNPCSEIRLQNSKMVWFKRAKGWVVMDILESK